MKKLLTLTIALVMVIMLGSSVNAATAQTLPNDLYAIGSKYGMVAQDKVSMERYLNTYQISDEQANQILALAQQADSIASAYGTTDLRSLPTSVKDQLKSLAQSAASIAGVTVNFINGRVEVYKDGKLLDVIGKGSNLAYTGNASVAFGLTTIATIALAGLVVKKKFAYNA